MEEPLLRQRNALNVCPVPTLLFWLGASAKVWTELHSFGSPAEDVGGVAFSDETYWDMYDTEEEEEVKRATHTSLHRGIPTKLTDPSHFLRLYEPRHTLALLSLLPEIELWLRANRSIGMHPFAYQHVISKIEAFTNVSITSLVKPMDANFSAEGLSSFHNKTEEAGCESVEMCFWKKIAPLYAQHARNVLSRMPWLIVNNSVFQEALSAYETRVYRGTIIRSFTFVTSSEARVERLLRLVQCLWDRVDRRLSWRPPPPLLPWIDLDKVIGPPRRIPKPTADVAGSPTIATRKALEAIPIRARYRHHPWKQVLPTAVVYRYSEKCKSCDVYGKAFDLLPAIYRRICEHGHYSIVSCSPLILFIRMRETRMFRRLPSLSVYARSSHLRDRAEEPSFSQWDWTLKSGGRGGSNEDDNNKGSGDTEDALNEIDIDELREFLRRPDDFREVPVPHLYIENPKINNVILSVLMTLVKQGSIQLRLLSRQELLEIRKSNREFMEEANRLNQSRKEASPEGDMPNASSDTNMGPPKKFQNVSTIDKSLKNLIEYHMERIFDNSTQQGAKWSVEPEKDATSSHSQPSSWYGLAWSRMTGLLDGIISSFYLILLILLVIEQYRWNRHRTKEIW
ncbi:unnamed protein product [Phytomonas sp. EM1]|nr:unnamed protein product [Phytomonas sp. EM1]|eukprot:CCW62014.1 unnamed protein product [Phytomonas sp. isolate EM1]